MFWFCNNATHRICRAKWESRIKTYSSLFGSQSLKRVAVILHCKQCTAFSKVKGRNLFFPKFSGRKNDVLPSVTCCREELWVKEKHGQCQGALLNKGRRNLSRKERFAGDLWDKWYLRARLMTSSWCKGASAVLCKGAKGHRQGVLGMREKSLKPS